MRVAVFVDAGYVFAQGSCAVAGSNTPRSRNKIKLNEQEIIGVLEHLARTQSGGKELLRIYWYDAAPEAVPTADQTKLARSNNVKLRLGQLNANGQQKGVDSLIVTDLAELARNRAISDALLLTGDEDIRVGVQQAQNHGVRVHLLGIMAAAEKHKQSEKLQYEADTVVTLSRSQVAAFLSVEADLVAEAPVRPSLPKIAPPKNMPAAAVHQVVEWLRKEGKLEQAAKIVAEGKEPPGYAVKHLNEILPGLLGVKASAADKKACRNMLSEKLKAVHHAS